MTRLPEAVEQVKAAGRSKPRVGRDPVNQPMINNWLEAIGDRNPIYVDEPRPEGRGPSRHRRAAGDDPGVDDDGPRRRPSADDDPLTRIIELFDEAGYIGVVATNCEQTYHRYLRPGEEVSVSAELTDVIGPKQTALGEGYFINQHIIWQVGDEDVAEMKWRIMKFRPRDAEKPAPVPDDLDADAMMRPVVLAGHPVLLGRRQRARTAHPEAARRQPAASAGARGVAGQRSADRLRRRQR